MPQSRQLAAIMFTDIVGYTALMGDDEQKAFELLKKNRSVQRPIIEKFNGGPVGISTIATAVGEEAGTIEEVYEPYLIKEGYIKRTSRGREATKLAYEHLDVTQPPSAGTLF